MGYLRFGGFDDGGGFSFLVGVLWMVEGGGGAEAGAHRL